MVGKRYSTECRGSGCAHGLLWWNLSFTGSSLVILLTANVGCVGESRAQLGTGVLAKGLMKESWHGAGKGCAWKCGLMGITAWELNNSHGNLKTDGKSLIW